MFYSNEYRCAQHSKHVPGRQISLAEMRAFVCHRARSSHPYRRRHAPCCDLALLGRHASTLPPSRPSTTNSPPGLSPATSASGLVRASVVHAPSAAAFCRGYAFCVQPGCCSRLEASRPRQVPCTTGILPQIPPLPTRHHPKRAHPHALYTAGWRSPPTNASCHRPCPALGR